MNKVKHKGRETKPWHKSAGRISWEQKISLLKQAYKEYLEHIALGNDRRSWCFEHEGMTMSNQTMDILLRKYPDFFCPEKMKAAKAKCLKVWEGHTTDCAIGKNTKANAKMLAMIMRNKCGWDLNKPESEADQQTVDEFKQVMQLMKQRQTGENSEEKTSLEEEKCFYFDTDD
mgnify:CR=1 FL=1